MKKDNKSSSAGTKDDSSTNVQDKQVSQPNANEMLYGVAGKRDKLFLVECFFWKDNWINEEPFKRLYGSIENCFSFLKTENSKNTMYKPKLDYVNMTLSFMTDERRNYYFRIVEIYEISSNAV